MEKSKPTEKAENSEEITHDEESRKKVKKTEIKNARASGIGALGRSEENQIEKLNNEDLENNKPAY